MPFADRINELWGLLRAGSRAGAQARQRTAATAAMAAFLLTLLASVGLFRILLLTFGVVAFGAAVVGVAVLARRHGRSAVARAVAAGTAVARGASTSVAAHAPVVRSRVDGARAAATRRLASAATKAEEHGRSARSRFRSSTEAWPAPKPIDRQREALRLNAAGAQLRRGGAYAEAADQHALALALFRELGDRRAEALTINNLALALDRTGDPAALDLFEEAATILGEIGEEQHEGQVIANMALAFRRRGSEERSAEVLDVALAKLDPDSPAYRKVENLRRAS